MAAALEALANPTAWRTGHEKALAPYLRGVMGMQMAEDVEGTVRGVAERCSMQRVQVWEGTWSDGIGEDFE